MAAGSLWFEAAVDGIVLHDVDDDVARFLGSIRRLIASGKVRRLSAYAHPNWVKSEDEAPLFNDALAADDLKRSGHRLKALEVLLQAQSWADVARESQELVEIALKALLRACRIEVPRIHDVSLLLEENMERLPAGIREKVPELVRISRMLRRDRELAFYGSEDLTPSKFYHRDDVESAFASARFVHAEVSWAMGSQAGSMPGGQNQIAAQRRQEGLIYKRARNIK